ncbi:MAG: winged helix-turn-helix transcriptional regulator [Leptospiraceae bacterium]|nr:winged helix-turn-helix transcriptional regulator [Leptospiraceae bacterium]MCP5502005.1 winged helix-turn-helix transcriptional regulator [Leptospiraceae bacterium]
MAKLKFELNKKQLEAAVKGIQGIAHPVRLMILYALSKEELSVGELSEFTGVSQSVTSQHLSKMRDNGILESRKESNKVFYYAKDPKFVELVKNIIKIYSEAEKSGSTGGRKSRSKA